MPACLTSLTPCSHEASNLAVAEPEADAEGQLHEVSCMIHVVVGTCELSLSYISRSILGHLFWTCNTLKPQTVP